jgi:hypothetical protein
MGVKKSNIMGPLHVDVDGGGRGPCLCAHQQEDPYRWRICVATMSAYAGLKSAAAQSYSAWHSQAVAVFGSSAVSGFTSAELNAAFELYRDA